MALDQAGPGPAESSETRAPADSLERVWAVAGLLAGAVLVWMAIDLLRGPKIPDETGGEGDG